MREWIYTYEVCITRKKKEVDATITEKFLSFSTSNNMTSPCSHLIVFARFLKNEIMVMKLKLWAFRPTWCAGLIITSHQFQAWFLRQVEKTTFLIKIFQVSCCRCKGKKIFKLVSLASIRSLRRCWAIPNVQILLCYRNITFWNRLIKFYCKNTIAKSC